ncbi:MAG: hypothetical protein R2932_36485 [Caldilineaceae bacterium]
MSHDRNFLNATVTTIVEIQEHNREAKVYSGNYDFYAEVKVQEREKWVESYWAQQEEIRELRKLMKSKARTNPLPVHRVTMINLPIPSKGDTPEITLTRYPLRRGEAAAD